MSTIATSGIRELSRSEIHELLARNSVGRMVYSRGSQIDVEPVHYVSANGWLYGRTAPGRELDVAPGQWWPVALAVDEVDDRLRWRSAVVHGGFYTLDPAGAEWERDEARRAAEFLGIHLPADLTDPAPVPTGGRFFRIGVQEVSGRSSE